MSWLNRFWRLPVLAVAASLTFAACADDEGAEPTTPPPPVVNGTITGRVVDQTGAGVVGALVGTSPATATSLTDASGNFTITNVPPGSYAVTASKESFTSASATTTVTAGGTSTVNLTLTRPTVPPPATQGNLNVLVTNRNGQPQAGVAVVARRAGATDSLTATTDATGFVTFTNITQGSYTVRAATTIAGIPFRASGGVNVRAGETAFLQLSLGRDFGQTVFPNIGGAQLTDAQRAALDISLISVPGGDANPEVDCNIIRTQHMYIAEVSSGSSSVSGVKVEWDLNISENGTITVECPELFDDPAGCKIPTVPGNTGSIVDTDDPDLDPSGARGGLTPAFEVDSRRAVTFTNDGSQTISFGGTNNVTVGAGQTWIVITSPVEGVTDVIVSSPDIPITNPDCANNDPDQCDKEFAIKRWVNWATAVYEVTWPDSPGPTRDIYDSDEATFDEISDGGEVINILRRREEDCARGDRLAPNCELFDNRVAFLSEVERLRSDSPFNISRGTMIWDITDDSPDVDFIGEDGGDGCTNGICNAEHNGPSDDLYTVNATRNQARIEFDANNNAFDGGVITANPLCTQPCDEDDFIGWGIVEVRLDPTIFFCVDVDVDGDCEPSAVGSSDTFSTQYQRLLANTIDNTNTFRVRFIDEFGEICDEFTFTKRWLASRLRVIKSTPDMTLRTVAESAGGPDVLQNDPLPLNTHTVQVGQTFSYRVTAISEGDVASVNVRITDTLPRFGVQFDRVLPDDGEFTMRNGGQAFEFQRDRPTFDPRAIVYAIDTDNDEPNDDIDVCIRGDDGTAIGNAYVVPSTCFLPGVIVTDAGSVENARAAAVSASTGGATHDQVVWIQWFDDRIARFAAPGGLPPEPEDSVEIFLTAVPTLYTGLTLPRTWCNIATVTDGPLNRASDLFPESFDADTLCHEVRQALLDVRKTTADAVIGGGQVASWTVEVANLGSATLTNVVLADTLDPTFAARKLTSADIVLLAPFTGATVTINPDSFTFSVNIGDLAPRAFTPVFRVSIPTQGRAGVFCNRVTARGTSPSGTLVETDLACVTMTVAIEMDISNEDGFIDAGGVFQSAKEIFRVGESGNAFAYQVIITNRSTFTATGVRVVDQAAPNTGIFECTGIRGGFPTRGTVAGGTCAPGGFTWNIGTLNGGESAEIQFFARAVRAGNDVNRARLTVDQLSGETIDEETTTITP